MWTFNEDKKELTVTTKWTIEDVKIQEEEYYKNTSTTYTLTDDERWDILKKAYNYGEVHNQIMSSHLIMQTLETYLKDRNTKKAYTVPEWCQEGDWVYDCYIDKYAEVIDVEGDKVTLHYEKHGKCCERNAEYICNKCIEGELYGYSMEDMIDLVGKVIHKDDKYGVVLGFDGKDLHVACFGTVSAKLLTMYRDDEGNPCGYKQRYDCGAWLTGYR